MIREGIIVTADTSGTTHIRPLGATFDARYAYLAPFRPSETLENLTASGSATLNFTDDVRVFAGCLTGRDEWPLVADDDFPVPRLENTLTTLKLQVDHIDHDELRPKFACDILATEAVREFRGFNRAQAAVVEAAILFSRVTRLPREKIEAELAYLGIAMAKTAGEGENEAWTWLLDAFAEHGIKSAGLGSR